MDTISSLVTIIVALAIIFVPQVLAIYFSSSRKTEREEYLPDGR